MEEIYSISKIYYKTCVDFSLLKLKGAILFLSGFMFMVITLYLIFKHHGLREAQDHYFIAAQVAEMVMLIYARNEYDRNLVLLLQSKTQNASSDIKIQKALYLTSLTSHIGSSFFEVMKNINETQKIHRINKLFTPDSFGNSFVSFIYDPESKNRILSLLIYLISLITMLTVVKSESTISIYSIIEELNIHMIFGFFGWSAFIIILFYLVFMWMFTVAFSCIISPVMLTFANKRFLLKYLMTELSKYAFLDKKLAAQESNM